MLSYQHAFHAGNHADVLKHIVLLEILRYLQKKEKGFVYIDTHAGAGAYRFTEDAAKKTGEYQQGVGKLNLSELVDVTIYPQILKEVREREGKDYYPGSPALAAHCLRAQDSGWFFELHSKEFTKLAARFQKMPRIHVRNEDGMNGLSALLPPTPRRGLVLIDPSYEIKSDFQSVINLIDKSYRRFSTGIYALWYPVIERNTVNQLKSQMQELGIPDIVCFELSVTGDSGGRGMTGSGMIVINPPWQLARTMDAVLPVLARQLAQTEHAGFVSDVLVSE